MTRPLSSDCLPECEWTELYVSGTGGYHTYRIPALLVTQAGTVLAFCEGRKCNAADDGDIDLVLRTSFDAGRTWGGMSVVADDGEHTIGNPCPVVDRRSGTICLPICRDNKRVLLMTSGDEGRSWSRLRDITEEAVDPAWCWVGTGPGHGIQLSSGRLVVPCWADATPIMGEVQFSFVIYSDDGGASWRRSAALDLNASDECEVVELSDGPVYMNMRHRGERGKRAYSHSRDGGETWSSVAFDSRLPEPSCQGSIVRLPGAVGTPAGILLCCPANPAARDHLTLRVSWDDCRNWPVAKLLYPGAAAYSDLAVAPDRSILCLFEADEYRRLLLARFDVE